MPGRCRRARYLAVVFTGVLLAVSLSACEKAQEAASASDGGTAAISASGSSKTLFHIDGQNCTLAQARVYLVNYQNIYGKKYGVNLMQQPEELPEFETYIKTMAVTQLAQTVCMAELADEQEMSLSEAQQECVGRAAEEYYQSLTPEEVEYFSATQESIQKMYEKYALACLVYTSLTDSVNEEVSDDEARIMQAQQIITTSEDTAGQIAQKLEAGEEFAALAADYSEADSLNIAFGRGDLPEEVETAAFALENGEHTGCIETAQGYYFIYCVNKFDEELTEKNKEVIAQERRTKAFDTVYDEYIAGVSSEINKNAWDQLSVNTNGQLVTDSFFTTFEKMWPQSP